LKTFLQEKLYDEIVQRFGPDPEFDEKLEKRLRKRSQQKMEEAEAEAAFILKEFEVLDNPVDPKPVDPNPDPKTDNYILNKIKAERKTDLNLETMNINVNPIEREEGLVGNDLIDHSKIEASLLVDVGAVDEMKEMNNLDSEMDGTKKQIDNDSRLTDRSNTAGEVTVGKKEAENLDLQISANNEANETQNQVFPEEGLLHSGTTNNRDDDEALSDAFVIIPPKHNEITIEIKPADTDSNRFKPDETEPNHFNPDEVSVRPFSVELIPQQNRHRSSFHNLVIIPINENA
jgi:hypothetical protein